MLHHFGNGGQAPQDQKASAADLRSTATTNHASDTTHSHSFADLLEKVAQAHEREVAHLRLEILHLTGGNSSHTPADVIPKHTIANGFLENLNSSLVPKIHVNFDHSPMEDMEISLEQEPCVLEIPCSSETCRMRDEQMTKNDALDSQVREGTPETASREQASPQTLQFSEVYDNSSSLSEQSFDERASAGRIPFNLMESLTCDRYSLSEVAEIAPDAPSNIRASCATARSARTSYSTTRTSCDTLLTGRSTVRPLERWHRLISYAKSGSDYVRLEQRWQELTLEDFGGKGNIIAHMLEQRHNLWATDSSRRSISYDIQLVVQDTWYHWFHQATSNHILVLHPNSRLRVFWDLLGMVLLIHDFVMTPLQVFEHGTGGLNESYMNFWGGLDIVASIFWTFDICISFVTAFYSDEGFVVVDHWKIAHHYLRSWFPLDITIVTVDWVGYVLNFDSQVGYLRVGKALSRFLRILRLLRFMKLSEKFTAAISSINSEYLYTLVGVLKLLVGIITVNHYIACTWYLLSQMELEETWSKSQFLTQPEDFHYMYLTSMHWSLTQFTPASMEVYPTNKYERLYTIVVIIGAMVTFSSFVSSITGAMTHLRMINAKKAESDAAFRRYFSTNNVSMELARQVWHFRRNNVMVNKTRMKESDLPALKFLPSRLRETLRLEVFFPILQPHPVFALLYDLCPDVTMQICTEALSERHVFAGEALKEITYPIRSMIFVCMGDLKYFFLDARTQNKDCALSFVATKSLVHKGRRPLASRNNQGKRRRSSHNFRVTASQSTALLQETSFVKVTPGQWACEVSLWSDGGTLAGPFCAGEAGCDIVVLSGQTFRSIVQKHNLTDGVQLAAHYAKVFIERFNEARLEEDFEDILFNDEDMLHHIMSVATGEMLDRCKVRRRDLSQPGGRHRSSSNWLGNTVRSLFSG